MDTAYKLRNSKLGPRVVDALKKRYFDAWYFDDQLEAVDTVFSLISKEHLVSWGSSMTVTELGIQERLEKEGYNLIDKDKAPFGSEERMELMRKALLCDTFLCGSNAISEDGQLVNIDNYGNRTAAMIFGPKQVIVVAGINKVVKTVEDAMVRARTIAAPLNIQRFPSIATPCNKIGSCTNCLTQDTVCNYFVTIRLCKPAGRIKVILIGKNLGL
ncbi:MAG: lactate utilization protein [Synergistaceae bacterium]|jgi:L-lactate utilization protein LutB|nr:lactate utilization protein [Synergistaceae bacterium]